MSHTAAGLDQALLDDIRRRRAELRESMSALEQALASPATGSHDRWAVRVHVALVELSADLRLHVDVTEADGGLHDDLREAEPRLAHEVDALTADHDRLREGLDDLMLLLEGPYPVTDIESIRVGGMRLLGLFSRHRQRGADLVFEAFSVDVGGET